MGRLCDYAEPPPGIAEILAERIFTLMMLPVVLGKRQSVGAGIHLRTCDRTLAIGTDEGGHGALLREAGYQTGFVGKFGVGSDPGNSPPL